MESFGVTRSPRNIRLFIQIIDIGNIHRFPPFFGPIMVRIIRFAARIRISINTLMRVTATYLISITWNVCPHTANTLFCCCIIVALRKRIFLTIRLIARIVVAGIVVTGIVMRLLFVCTGRSHQNQNRTQTYAKKLFHNLILISKKPDFLIQTTERTFSCL